MGGLWVSAHIAIKGNEAIDKEAKNAIKFPKISLNICPPASDLIQLFRKLIFKNWSLSWNNQIHDNKSLKNKKKKVSSEDILPQIRRKDVSVPPMAKNIPLGRERREGGQR